MVEVIVAVVDPVRLEHRARARVAHVQTKRERLGHGVIGEKLRLVVKVCRDPTPSTETMAAQIKPRRARRRMDANFLSPVGAVPNRRTQPGKDYPQISLPGRKVPPSTPYGPVLDTALLRRQAPQPPGPGDTVAALTVLAAPHGRATTAGLLPPPAPATRHTTTAAMPHRPSNQRAPRPRRRTPASAAAPMSHHPATPRLRPTDPTPSPSRPCLRRLHRRQRQPQDTGDDHHSHRGPPRPTLHANPLPHASTTPESSACGRPAHPVPHPTGMRAPGPTPT